MDNSEKAQIFYKDIGDYLSREEKLKRVSENRNILSPELNLIEVQPNEHGDWINKRNSKFDEFIPLMGDDKLSSNCFFTIHGPGVLSSRDAWVNNFSIKNLSNNMRNMILFYNEQKLAVDNYIKKQKDEKTDDIIDLNPKKISWTVNLKNDIKKGIVHKFEKNSIIAWIYRPYCEQNIYFDDNFIERPGLHKSVFFPNNAPNLLICLNGIGSTKNPSLLIISKIPSYDLIDKTQCFPLYWYEKKEKVQGNLFDCPEDEYIRRDGISDFILDQAKTRYGYKVAKEDIFYYVYGVLHSPEYRKTFANDLKKMLPRLPLVEKTADFWIFSEAGRKLADLHLNYEDQKKPAGVKVTGENHKNFTVTKMTFPAKGKIDTIIYNPYITISNIPEKAYQYIVNGKSAIEWIIERYAVTVHKESGIKNDPNDWAIEHNNPRYILDLLLSVIKLSMETVDIIKNLPKLEF
jgi:predicted helicase